MQSDDEIDADAPAVDPDRYIREASFDELRRYACLDMARLSGAMPDKAVKLARDMERFLMGRSLWSAEVQD